MCEGVHKHTQAELLDATTFRPGAVEVQPGHQSGRIFVAVRIPKTMLQMLAPVSYAPVMLRKVANGITAWIVNQLVMS